MSPPSIQVSGVLNADGVSIRLDTKIALPAGRVSVTVSAEARPTPERGLPDGFLSPGGEPTGRYAAYLKYQEKYAEAKQTLASAYSAALSDPAQIQQWPITSVSLSSAVDSAWDEWVTLGFKNEIERQLAGRN
jgi:hypothetical protein